MTNQQVIAHFDSSGRTDSIRTTDNIVESLRNLLSSYQHVFVVRGERSFEESGAAAFLKEVRQGTDIVYHPFSSFAKNPKKEDAIVGAHELISSHSEAIIAIGGGSAIDTAKLIRHYAQLSVPLVAVPTTAGTGSESTQFAVCFIDGVKTSVDHPSILPNVAILMPELTMSGSKYLAVTCAFDAFSQAVESYWNIRATDESDEFAKEAITKIFKGLTQFIESHGSCIEQRNWREMMMGGANLAGKAINLTRTTAPHAMSYILSSNYNYPHGHAVALTFPYFAKLNILCPEDQYMGRDINRYQEKMVWLTKCLGLVGRQDIEDTSRKVIKALGLGYREDSKVDATLVAQSINLERAGNNPHKLTAEIITQAAESILKM